MKDIKLLPYSLIIVLSLVCTALGFSQTNPTAQQIPYSQDFSSLGSTSTTFPSGWQGWKLSSLAGENFSLLAPTAGASLIASGTAASSTNGVYNYNGKVGFLNSATGDYSLILAVKTTGNTNVYVEYAISTIRNPYNGSSNTAINGVELQYRVGTSGEFKSINSRVYINNTTSQTSSTTTPQNSKVFSMRLPSECDNQNTVQLRWVARKISGSGSMPGFAIDNVDIRSAGKATNYYYKGSGSLASVSSWSSTKTGTGASPSNFTNSNQSFYILNTSIATLSENWTVSGDNSKVIVGNGSSVTALKTTGSAQLNGVVDVEFDGKLIIGQSTSNIPTLGTMYPGSRLEVLFTASLPYLPAEVTYENLLLNSAGGHTYRFTIASANILIKKDFSISNTLLENNGSSKFQMILGGSFTMSSGASFGTGFSNYANLVLNGSYQQVITLNGIILNLNSLTVLNNAGIALSNSGGSSNVNLSSGTANELSMDGGNVVLNSNTITLGSSSSNSGELNYVSGFLSGNGTFARWYPKTGLPTGYERAFPMGAGNNDRSLYLIFTSSTITTGGKLSVSHFDGTGSVAITPFSDSYMTINKRSNMNWVIRQTEGWNMGTTKITLKAHAYGLSGVNDPAQLSYVVNNNQKPAGNYVVPNGSIDEPKVYRSDMTITDIGSTDGRGNTFYVGSSNSNPLPVVLAEFTCNSLNRDAILSWTTTSEINNKGFEVERSKELSASAGTYSAWENVGFVQGKGTTNNQVQYSFADKKLVDGKYRYRIKQVDFNGNFEYFNGDKDVTIGKPGKFELSQNYPNPSNPKSKIDFELPFDASVSIKVFDLTGQEVAVLVNGNIAAGYHSSDFDGSNLASGVYIYRLIAKSTSGESFSKTMKMVLVK